MSRNAKAKSKHKRYRPYQVVKSRFFKIPNPFAGVPLEVRRKAILEMATKAKEAFDAEYPKLIGWFDAFDPLYVLSFCVLYFLASEQGVDKEAVDGKLDFASHHLELLQAFALMRPRVGTPAPLKDKATELQRTMKDLTDSLGLAQLASVTENTEDAELKKLFVINEMRMQTLAIRNWAFPEQTFTHLKTLFSGQLEQVIAREHGGVSITRLIDTLQLMADETNNRLNVHLNKLRPMIQATTFETAYKEYCSAFGVIKDDTEEMRRIFTTMCGGDLRSFKALMMTHSDLFLDLVFTFTPDDIGRAYGDPAQHSAVLAVMKHWSHGFGDLGDRNPLHFLYSNPVLTRPFISLANGSFFWVLGGIAAHTMPAMLEVLIPQAERSRYSEVRSKYLEDTVEAILRKGFPDGVVFRGSQWRPSPGDPTLYENDLLVLLDSVALIVECKSHQVDAPARRGAAFRLVDTLEDLVVSASDQAVRFAEFLKNNPAKHEFSTRHGVTNIVDTRRIVRFIPISITYENLGFVSANLKDAVSAGLIEAGHSLVPSICLTDLEVAFELLESQAQKVHYLARRAEIEQTMNYTGDESDLLAFYMDTGFNVGEAEAGDMLIQLAMESKKLDPYFVARADGIAVPKPSLKLTEWWRDLLERIEHLQTEFWPEVAYVLLSIAHKDQQKFERNFYKLADRVDKGRVQDKHNWATLFSGTKAKRQYAVIGFPYKTLDRDTRNNLLKHMAAQAEQEMPLSGMVVLGIDIDNISYPYNVIAYIPGHAEGVPPIAPLLPK